MSVNVSVPVFGPMDEGANVTFSEQLLPGASGEADKQFCVDVNEPLAATPVIYNGAVPVFVIATA